jgi:hypothetical protein
MQPLRLNKIAERVTLLQTDAAGNVIPIRLFKKKNKKSKKANWINKPGTTAMQRMRDFGSNVFDALEQGRKTLGKGGFPM